jgi:hypothetical protein
VALDPHGFVLTGQTEGAAAVALIHQHKHH